MKCLATLRKKAKAEAIIGIAILHNQINKLIKYCLLNRPRVQPFAYHETNWRSIITESDSAVRIGDPLFQYVGNQRVRVPPRGKFKLWYHELGDALMKYYDDDEFRKMCADLNYNYVYINHLKRAEQTSEIVAYGIDFNMIGKIVHYCKWNRPRVQPLWVHDIPWDDIATRAAAAMKTDNPLNDPILAKRIREKK